MAQVDLSSINFFLPLLSFLVVFILSFFLIKGSKLIDSPFWIVAVSFIIGVVFVSAIGPRNYVLTVIPWFAVLLVIIFMVMAMGGFLGKDVLPAKGIGIVALIIMALIFIISALFVFRSYYAENLLVDRFISFIISPGISGAIILIVIAAIVGWILVKGK